MDHDFDGALNHGMLLLTAWHACVTIYRKMFITTKVL
jgi:hypothetical protein